MSADRRLEPAVDRRRFLSGAATSLLSVVPLLPLLRVVQDTVQTPGPSGKLWDPNRAGPSLQPVTAEDNDAAIQAIEKRIKCTCGCGLDVYTCRTTDFTCPQSPKMHRHVIELSQAGMTGEAIVAQFVQEHGLEILMAPPERGFNLTGYWTPAAAMLAAGAILFVVMRRWVRRAPPAPAVEAPHAPGASAGELERLREALRHTEA
jgi:cytochrome c-type biogenesis protein CcmH/NrfF